MAVVNGVIGEFYQTECNNRFNPRYDEHSPYKDWFNVYFDYKLHNYNEMVKWIDDNLNGYYIYEYANLMYFSDQNDAIAFKLWFS